MKRFVSVTSDLRASPACAWDLLTDTARWPLWGPAVRAVACSDRHIRQGARGRVRLPIVGWLPFVVTEYEHLRYWSWKVAGIRATGHRLIGSGAYGCRVVFELPVVWLPYALVCRRAASKLSGLLAAEARID